MSYYDNKLGVLARLFGDDDIEVDENRLRVGSKSFPIVDDVILALPEELRPTGSLTRTAPGATIARDIQETFGREWRRFDQVLPEQRLEFEQYFDIVDRASLADAVVCDLGAGMGRWSLLAAPSCAAIVLVDFSDAIFVARRTLREFDTAVFVMADITALPFADDCCEFAMCIGVLHTLPVDAIATVAAMARLAPELLVYLMHALDNRPAHFGALLRVVSAVRRRTARIDDDRARRAITAAIAWGVYRPLIALGRVARRVGLEPAVPLASDNDGKSMEGIKQVVYDRFFTSIEQRVTADEIRTLEGTFGSVRISDGPPYWHFLCSRAPVLEPG